MAFDGGYPQAVAAPALGDDTADVLIECLGLTEEEVVVLTESGTVATGSAEPR